MKGLTASGRILTADFFKESGLILTSQGTGSITRKVYDALWEKDLILKRNLLGGIRNLGELTDISIDTSLNPSLRYSPVEERDGIQVHLYLRKIPLRASDDQKWLEFMVDPSTRKGYGGFCLYLPPRIHLERQKF
jgi:hypothetical protein